MARAPVDPRLTRTLVAADGEGCLREVLVIVAASSVQDPRERPTDAQESATSKPPVREPRSDFLAYLNLWAHLKEQQRVLSGNAFRRMCRREVLNDLRVRVADLHASSGRSPTISGWCATPRLPSRTRAPALLTGPPSHEGVRIERDHRCAGRRRRHRPASAPSRVRGARGSRFAIAPGSALGQAAPAVVMAGELVETNRRARVVAGIRPEWVEELGAHLVTASTSSRTGTSGRARRWPSSGSPSTALH